MGKLTTHVLDTSAGLPAAGVRIEVHDLDSPAVERVVVLVTGANGRCAESLLEGTVLRKRCYLLTFHTGDYFRARGIVLPEPAFIDRATIRIGIACPDQHYHVPLLITPWSYSVYRGG